MKLSPHTPHPHLKGEKLCLDETPSGLRPWQYMKTNVSEYYYTVSGNYSEWKWNWLQTLVPVRPQTAESRSDPTILFTGWRKFLSVLLPTQLNKSGSIVPPAKQWLYQSLNHKKLNNQNRNMNVITTVLKPLTVSVLRNERKLIRAFELMVGKSEGNVMT
jgi:hypothetical protein